MVSTAHLIDATFIIERTQKTFHLTPLLLVAGKDATFAFGFLRDFLRMRRVLAISAGTLVIGKEATSLTSQHNIESVLSLLQELAIPCVHDPRHAALQLVGALASEFTHVITGDRRLLQLVDDRVMVVLCSVGKACEYDAMTMEGVKGLIGVLPARLRTYLALVDTGTLKSKQAVRLIERLGDIDSIYANLSHPSFVEG